MAILPHFFYNFELTSTVARVATRIMLEQQSYYAYKFYTYNSTDSRYFVFFLVLFLVVEADDATNAQLQMHKFFILVLFSYLQYLT